MIPIHRVVCSLAIMTLMIIVSIPAADAAAYTVAPAGAAFTSIQAAIDQASPGDAILVQSGTYQENILLDKKIDLMGVDIGGEHR